MTGRKRASAKKAFSCGLRFSALAFLVLKAASWPPAVEAFPQEGKFTLSLNSTRSENGLVKNVYKGTRLFVDIKCSSAQPQTVTIGWIFRETECWNDFAYYEMQQGIFHNYYLQRTTSPVDDAGGKGGEGEAAAPAAADVHMFRGAEKTFQCNNAANSIQLPPFVVPTTTTTAKPVDPAAADAKEAGGGTVATRSAAAAEEGGSGKPETVHTEFGPKRRQPLLVVDSEGDYLFVIHISGSGESSGIDTDFQASVNVELKGDFLGGYLSVVDWPLLPFYGVMCGVYVCMGIGWLVVCAMHFRELLRIQFWIGGVIFLGMLEKAMFYAEFQNINSNGVSAQGLIFVAELVSCGKRTLARMLVIIVSVGFGIVKPRLGPTLHRVVGVGGFFFVLATTEAYLRITKPKNDISTSLLLAEIPLAVTDAAICWWVFTSLTSTLRQLKLRRNLVKFKLYRHFTNVLIFAVIASIIFGLADTRLFRMADCLKDWRELWVKEAFWHLLFSILLAFIMILWTPSNNNKRYAFQPLLDNDEDDSDDEDFNALLPDVYEGMKHRMNVLQNGKSGNGDAEEGGSAGSGANPEEDPLKWVEENIPETADTENPLPVIDSEEEIETTRFELSKMQ